MDHSTEISSGDRFSFGKNWAQFLEELDEDRIILAEESIRNRLNIENLSGKRLIDIGSGSGLFSLAARRLGAVVHSFDYDPHSFACTQRLQQLYFKDEPDWVVESGSVLDEDYMSQLGKWDIVYSWGVLHHTGNMNLALANVADLVENNGLLFIAIYNDQGITSKIWLKIKKAYNALPPRLRWLVLYPAFLRTWGPTLIRDILTGKPFQTWKQYAENSERGMSPWRDHVDWVGGLPFEVAKPEEIFDMFFKKGFQMEKLSTCGGGYGCNEFVFRKTSSPVSE